MINRTGQLLIILAFLCCGFHWWDPLAKWIGIGNEAYEKQDFEKALDSYKQAEKFAPDSAAVQENLGTVLARQKDTENALKKFEIASKSDDPEIKSKAFYNKGCLEMGTGDFKEAEESFKKALMANPADEEAKTNLELTQLMAKMQTITPTPPPQQNQDNNDEQDQDQQQTPSPSTPSPSTPEPSTPQPQTPQPQPQETPTPPNTPQSASGSEAQPTMMPSPTPENTQPQIQAGEMSRQEAERLLDASEEEEFEVLKRFHMLPEVDEKDVEKDW